LVPPRVAFQLLVMRLSPAYCQLTFQPLMALVLVLVIFMVAVNPLFHWLATKYWHPA
jgi:hypothetical protein